MKTGTFPVALAACLWAATCMAQQNSAADKPAADKTVFHAIVQLDDGSRLLGAMPADFTLSIQSTVLKAGIAIKWVDTIAMSADHKTAVVEMRNGDQVSVTLSMKALPLKTALGNFELAFDYIKSVEVLDSEVVLPKGLVFWNKLESDRNLRRSIVGPALAPYVGERTGDMQNIIGDREFIKGDHGGGAVTIKGAYKDHDEVHNLVLGGLDKLVNSEQGCIEFWYCQAVFPVEHGEYRMVDGVYGMGGCVRFYATDRTIMFALNCGGQKMLAVECGQLTYVGPGMQLAYYVPVGKWVHLAAVWNRKGIGGTRETARLYLNGKQVAATKDPIFGPVTGGAADICGGDDDCAGRFMMNDLKIWNYSKTQFDTTKVPDVDPKNLHPHEPLRRPLDIEVNP